MHLRALGSDATDLSWPPGDEGVTPQLQAKLAAICASSCLIQVSHASKDASVPLLSALHSLQKVAPNQPGLELFVNLRAPGTPAPVSGRLPPEVIQRVVREHFELFRKCYEVGLGRDATLEGRVTVRFVISREGKVENPSDSGSDLPDAQVRECVINAFKQLEFPKPENGIVTVVYPIMLAPG